MDNISVNGQQAKLFKGDTYLNLMPELKSEGYVPIGGADVIRERTGTNKDFWTTHYFDTSDAVIYLEDKMKIVKNYHVLTEINPENTESLIIKAEDYHSIDAPELTQEQLEKAGESILTPEQAKKHPVWQTLAESQAQLDSYVDYFFNEYERSAKEKSWAVSPLEPSGMKFVSGMRGKPLLPEKAKNAFIHPLAIGAFQTGSYIYGNEGVKERFMTASSSGNMIEISNDYGFIIGTEK